MAYDFINELPHLDSVDPLPTEFVADFVKNILPLLQKSTAEDFTVRVGHSFFRKGYESFDTLGKRNTAYGHPSDDFAIQISLRVREDEKAYKPLKKLEVAVTENIEAKERAEKEAHVEALRQELAKAEAALGDLK